MLRVTLVPVALAIGSMLLPLDLEAREKRQRLPEKGSTIVLHKPVQTDAGTPRAYIQSGQPVTQRGATRFEPTCYLLLHRNEKGGVTTIEAGSFTVRNASNYRRQGFTQLSPRWRLAAASLDGLQLAQGSDIYLLSDMKLEDNPQGVKSLICYIQYAYGTAITPFLFLDEMQETLGSLVSFQASGQ